MTIQDIMAEYNLTTAELSRCFSIPYRTVQDWKLGNRKCPEYIIKMIDELLKREQ